MGDKVASAEEGRRLLQDLQRVVMGALETNGALLTGGERTIASRILALRGPAGRLYARLVGRRGQLFRADRLDYEGSDEGLDELVRLGLVHEGVPWPMRASLFTVAELKDRARALGLKVGGGRQALVERLSEQRGWSSERIIRVAYKPLVRKLELLWFRDPWRDRSVLLLERIGQQSWPEYQATGGGRCFATRSALLAFRSALAATDLAGEECLEWARRSEERPRHLRRLDARRLWLRRAQEQARELEREGQLERAEALYRGILELRPRAEVSLRLAMVLDRSGRPGEGAELCGLARAQAGPGDRIALERTGRRLARKAGGAWIPAPPPRPAAQRRVELVPAGSDGRRPLWGPLAEPVEPAVARALRPRVACLAENTLWTTLFSLLLLDLYWLPVPDMLPTRWLDGPMDLGTPAFADNRRDALQDRLAALRSGQGLALMRLHRERWRGQRVRGLAWDAWPDQVLDQVVLGVGDAGLTAVVERLLSMGWAAARGLPDLAVLPGEPLRLAGAVPARVGPGFLLVEVKGPGDTLRDEQRAWHDALARAQVPVEVWRVGPAGTNRSQVG
jgi:hypothetical protein